MRINSNIAGGDKTLPAVYICSPVQDKPALCFTASLADTVLELYKNDIRTIVRFAKKDCFIDRARNRLIDDFMKTGCTHMLMIDDDQGWEAKKINDMIKCDVDALFCVVRQKEIEEKYAIRVNVDNDRKCIEKNGLISCHRIGMAFSLFKRNLFDIMHDKLDLPMTKDTGRMYTDVHVRDTGILSAELGEIWDWVGEDYDFCEKLEKCDIPLWIYPDMDITHVGQYEFKNNFHEYLCRQPGGSKYQRPDAMATGISEAKI